MQQTVGNQAVQRFLARSGVVQRDPPASAGSSGASSGGWSLDPTGGRTPDLNPRGGQVQDILSSIDQQVSQSFARSAAVEPAARQWVAANTTTLIPHVAEGIDALIVLLKQSVPNGQNLMDDPARQILNDWAMQHDQIIPQNAAEVALVGWITQNTQTLRSHVFDGIAALTTYTMLSAPQGANVQSARIQRFLNRWVAANNLTISAIPMFNAQPAANTASGQARTPVQGQLSYTLAAIHHEGVANAESSNEVQNQFTANMTWQMHQEGQAGLEVSAQAQVAYNQNFTQIMSITGGGQIAWVAPALNGLLQLSGFVQAMTGSASNSSTNPVTGQTQFSVMPTVQAAFGGQALFQLFGGKLQAGLTASAGPTVNLPSGQLPQATLDVTIGGVIQFAF
jgi:hypothetical protein